MKRMNCVLLGCCVAAVDLWLLLSRPAPVPRAELGLSATEKISIAAPEAPAKRRVAALASSQIAGEPAALPAQPGASSRVMRPRFAERPEGEWQGMLVNLNASPPCTSSAVCSMARACIDSRCTACAADSDCSSGEACVLDHCVPSENVTCRDRQDCASDSLCMLSGYSSEPRGNGEMRTLCSDPHSGAVKHANTRIVPRVMAEETGTRAAPYAELIENARRFAPR